MARAYSEPQPQRVAGGEGQRKSGGSRNAGALADSIRDRGVAPAGAACTDGWRPPGRKPDARACGLGWTRAQPTTRASLEAARYATAVQYESLFANQQDLLVEKNLKRGEAELIAVADTPRSPVSPKPVRDALLGAIVGLLLGAGISFLREQLDDACAPPRGGTGTGLPVLPDPGAVRDDVDKAPTHGGADRPRGAVGRACAARTRIGFASTRRCGMAS